MAVAITHQPDRSRYELRVDGELIGIADYVIRDGRVVFPHTEILPTHRGRGLAALLVRYALDDVRRSGRSVVASCWYVADFIDEHPEYRDLVA
jgi:predicted GNAT family acetyltransferase